MGYLKKNNKKIENFFPPDSIGIQTPIFWTPIQTYT